MFHTCKVHELHTLHECEVVNIPKPNSLLGSSGVGMAASLSASDGNGTWRHSIIGDNFTSDFMCNG